MAGRGPAPKQPGARRRYGQPARGEWVELLPLKEPVLPVADREWGANAKRAWRAWRADPVTSQYTPADVFAVQELARRFDRLAAGEQRLRMDSLGLTPKGKRDLRWRTPAEVKTIADQEPVKRLRLVEREAASKPE